MTAFISKFERVNAMREFARVVEVPIIEENELAYNHDRPISSLVMHQLRHLHAVEQTLPPEERTNINITTLHTELEASRYIEKVMSKLHPKAKRRRASRVQRAKGHS
jgi:hypothetical protein